MTSPMDETERAIAYTCKFCGKEGVTAVAKDCDEKHFNQLFPLLACNRCADYRVAMTRLRDSIQRTAIDVLRARQCSRISEKAKADLPEMESACRGTFVELTKKLATVHCTFRNLVTVWEPDFADILMRKPEKHDQAVNHFIRGIEAMRKQAS